ncbi:MAG: aldolase [Alphaproteobacteria bacterium]|nr:aldolase [Alphaproteobacteria bacterium]
MDAGRTITVLDCTLRDGGYYNNWVFDGELVKRYIAGARAAGVDVIEIGFRNPPSDGFLGAFAFSKDRYLQTLDLTRDIAFAVMTDAKVLLHDGNTVKVIDGLYVERSQSPVEIVRIAANISEVSKLGPAVARLKEKGYKVCLNIMQVGNKPPEVIEDLARTAATYDGLDVLYFADSFGNMSPDMVIALVRAMRSGWEGALGVHAHDNMNNALANTLAALGAGATWLDATVSGMGRGAGNLATEYLLHALRNRGYDKYHSEALLPVLVEDFVDLRHRYGWGPNFLYYLAALHGIHPTYLQRLQEPGHVDNEALINALDYLRNIPSNVFSEEALGRAMRADKAHVVGTWEPNGWAEGKDVLLVANGRGTSEHHQAITQFIKTHKPQVISLNYVEAISPELVDAYAVCHPSRLVRDIPAYEALDRPVFLPVDDFAKLFVHLLGEERVNNFGLTIEPDVFSLRGTGCTIPMRKVAPYALAIAAASNARRVFLAGFDGFAADDPRHQEMNTIFSLFRTAFPNMEIIALTPSSYDVSQSSIYAY